MIPSELVERLGNVSTPLIVILVAVLILADTTVLVGLLVPGDLVLLGAATAAGPDGAPLVVLAAVAAALAGQSGSYLLGRRFGPRVISSMLGRRVGAARWSAAERMAAGTGRWALLAVQFLPILNNLVPLLAGILRVPYRRFVVLTAMSSVLWSSAFAAVGAVARTADGSTAGSAGLLLAVVLAAVAGPILLTRTVRRNRRGPGSGADQSGGTTSRVGQQPLPDG